jgi:hypothetical protein
LTDRRIQGAGKVVGNSRKTEEEEEQQEVCTTGWSIAHFAGAQQLLAEHLGTETVEQGAESRVQSVEGNPVSLAKQAVGQVPSTACGLQCRTVTHMR